MTGWHALQAARTASTGQRVPFHVLHQGERLEAGSVARQHLGALTQWPQALQVSDTGVTLIVPAAQRNDCLADINRQLHAQGLIVAWRDEPYPVLAWRRGLLLGRFERAASRFWGTLTFGAHSTASVVVMLSMPALAAP